MEKTNGMHVNIKLSTRINAHGKMEENSFTTIGQIFYKGTSTYIKFDEPSANREDLTKQTIRFQQDHFTVIRNGAVSMNQQFVLGKETKGLFRSPYGVMEMKTKTKELSFHWDEEIGEGIGRIRYILYLQNEHAGEYDLKLTIKEAMINDESS